jgi:hypothetical protein
MLTQMHLSHACACHGTEDGNARTGQEEDGGGGGGGGYRATLKTEPCALAPAPAFPTRGILRRRGGPRHWQPLAHGAHGASPTGVSAAGVLASVLLLRLGCGVARAVGRLGVSVEHVR